ncbi:hypothetical protein N7454_005402 [Penicillium verhagenii]|nr:hypothetical protein N7454_005402 [Penicillium verhagenii]
MSGKEIGSIAHPEDDCSSCQTTKKPVDLCVACQGMAERANCQRANPGRRSTIQDHPRLFTWNLSMPKAPCHRKLYNRYELKRIKRMKEVISIDRDLLHAQMEVLRKQIEDADKQTGPDLGKDPKHEAPLSAEALPSEGKEYSKWLTGPWLRELDQRIGELLDKVGAIEEEADE